MRYKDFKGKSISTLGMGALRLPAEAGNPDRIDRAKGQAVIDAAFSHGINYFDTAYSYQKGDSERFLGEALAKYPRDSYFLATKFYVAYSDDIQAVFEEQLRRCRTDRFDFYLLHCLDETTFGPYTDPRRGYLHYLLRQRDAGRIGYIGFSSHAAPETLERFLDICGEFDMAQIQLNYLDWTLLDAKRQYEILTERGIPVWVMEPLKGGRLAALDGRAAEILRAAAPERSDASWALRFLQGLDSVQTVLSGMSSDGQVSENAALFDDPRPLGAQEQTALERASAALVESLGVPCSGCRYCCDACPAGLDIPLLIKGYNERSIGGSTWKIEGLSSAKAATACLGCGACRRRCPQKIDIPEVMRKIASL